MSTLWITEFSGAMLDGPIMTPVPIAPPVAEQTVTFTTSTLSAALNARTRLIRVIADAAFHLRIDGTATPTATTSHMKIPADTEQWIGVPAGAGTIKIAAINA